MGGGLGSFGILAPREAYLLDVEPGLHLAHHGVVDAALAKDFRERPPDTGPYTFLAADALAMKVREGGRVVKIAVMVATGPTTMATDRSLAWSRPRYVRDRWNPSATT
jgi:hypothetical protein